VFCFVGCCGQVPEQLLAVFLVRGVKFPDLCSKVENVRVTGLLCLDDYWIHVLEARTVDRWSCKGNRVARGSELWKRGMMMEMKKLLCGICM
jgi:hypothetical protein